MLLLLLLLLINSSLFDVDDDDDSSIACLEDATGLVAQEFDRLVASLFESSDVLNITGDLLGFVDDFLLLLLLLLPLEEIATTVAAAAAADSNFSFRSCMKWHRGP